MNERDRDRFVVELLDASLRRYGSEEPRAGLEARILAGVRARERDSRRRTWVWALGVAGAALAVIVVVLALPRHHPVATVNRSAIDRGLSRPTRTHGQESTDRGYQSKSPAIGPRSVSVPPKGIRRGLRVPAGPRRPEQFPTPAPLAEDEKLLLAYASRLPTAELDIPTSRELEIEPLKIRKLEIARIQIEKLSESGE